MLATTDWQAVAVFTMEDTRLCINRILAAMQASGFSDKDAFGTRLALEEALVNAVRHGHRNDTRKQVDVRFHISDSQLLIEVQDQGPGFDPDGLPDPLSPENLERPGGRGVFLMRNYMTWVQYNEAGNCVTLCKAKTG
jgi:serine/threonine-protein kinase RsbW